jgi:hypothetical protein
MKAGASRHAGPGSTRFAPRAASRLGHAVTIHRARPHGAPRRGRSIPSPACGGAMLRLLRAPVQTGLGAALGPAPGCAAALLRSCGCIFQDRLCHRCAHGPIICVVKAMGLRPSRGQGAEPHALRALRPHQTALPLLPPSPRRTGRSSCRA